jgi:hypothetical protein
MLEHFKRRERWSLAFVLVLGVAAALLSILAITGLSPRDIEDRLPATPADGSWKAVNFDGSAITSENFLVVIRNGRVVGGYDDCNGWSYEDQNPDRNGDRMMLSTLVQCPAEHPRRIYRTLVYAPKIDVLGKNELELSRDGHEGRFRRCKPDNERFRCVEGR